MPATANGNAAIQQSTIVAIAEASVDGVRYELASPLVTLDVAEPMLAVTFPKSKVARGATAEISVGLECLQEFAGEASAELLGLPAGVTAEKISFQHGVTELTFLVTASEKARLGRAGGLICRLTVVRDKAPIVHMLGTGQLRVDRPAARSPTAAANAS